MFCPTPGLVGCLIHVPTNTRETHYVNLSGCYVFLFIYLFSCIFVLLLHALPCDCCIIAVVFLTLLSMQTYIQLKYLWNLRFIHCLLLVAGNRKRNNCYACSFFYFYVNPPDLTRSFKTVQPYKMRSRFGRWSIVNRFFFYFVEHLAVPPKNRTRKLVFKT